MSPTLTTFLFEAANFLILAGVVGWLAFRPVRRALEQRQAEQLKQSQDAASKLAEAQQLEQKVEQRRASLEQELDGLRANARVAAEKQAAEIQAAARTAAEQESAAAAQRLVEMQRQQVERLAETVVATTRSSIERLLQQIDGPELEASLVTAACRQLPEIVGDANGAVTVESAAPLSTEQKEQIQSALGHAATAVHYSVVDELGTGVRIRTAAGLVDATAAGLARYAQQQLLREFDSESAEPASAAGHESAITAPAATPP